MFLRKGFRYRLRPNKDKLELFAKFAGCSRFIYNRGLTHRKIEWEKGARISYYDQTSILVKWKKEEETYWLNEVHSQVLQQSLKDLDFAYKHFLRRVANKENKAGYPRYKKRGINDSFRYPQGAKVKGDSVYLPKIGWVRFRKSRDLEGTIKQTTIIKEGECWYVSFSCEIEREDLQPVPISESRALGIDVGIQTFAAMVRGTDNVEEFVLSPGFLPHLTSQIQNLQKHLSRKMKGSNNWHKCRRKLVNLHCRVRNCRKDFIHKLSTAIVKSHDIICVENLGVKKMLQKAHRSLSRAISDCAWRQFLFCLKYKAEECGKYFVEVGKYFPSTKQCSTCGQKKSLSLSDRTYSCNGCGLVMNRDLNSAINIKAAGMSVIVNACGAPT